MQATNGADSSSSRMLAGKRPDAESSNERGQSGMNARVFKLFRTLIHRETGIWLRDNKEVMLASRLSRRLRQLDIEEFEEYFSYVEGLGAGHQELVELINCVTTNKTSFFREPHHFEFLVEQSVDQTRKSRQSGSDRSMQVWSAACSTGEEPYSIAISLLEARQQLGLSGAGSIKIIASDIDTKVIETARRGTYNQEATESLPDTFLKKYFLRGKGASQGQVRVKKEVAELVEFQRLNLNDANWPVPSSLDAIFFRNALIYFQPDTQERFLRKMVAFLKPGGYLFIGHSENVPWLHDVVLPLRNTIYQRRKLATDGEPGASKIQERAR